MDILLTIHSIVRWLIVAVGLIALVKFAMDWLGNGRFAGMDRGLTRGFSGLIDLGVFHLLKMGSFGIV